MKAKMLHPWLVVSFTIALCIVAIMVVPVLLGPPVPISKWPPFLVGVIAIGCVPAFITALFLPFWKQFFRTRTDELEQAPTSSFTKVTRFVMSAFVILYCLLLTVYFFSWAQDFEWYGL